MVVIYATCINQSRPRPRAIRRVPVAQGAAAPRPQPSPHRSRSPARIAISRPSARPQTTRRHEFELAVNIFRALQSGVPKLCFDPDCDNELRDMPEVRIFIRTTDTSPIAMGVCPQCAAPAG